MLLRPHRAITQSYCHTLLSKLQIRFRRIPKALCLEGCEYCYAQDTNLLLNSRATHSTMKRKKRPKDLEKHTSLLANPLLWNFGSLQPATFYLNGSSARFQGSVSAFEPQTLTTQPIHPG
jgi:hypothetical protein